MKLWKFSKSQPPKLLGFDEHGRTLFKTIAKLVIVYHKKWKFSDHLLGKLRFFPNLKGKHPFYLVKNVTHREFLRGKKIDLLHMMFHAVSFWLFCIFLFIYAVSICLSHLFCVIAFFFFYNTQTYNNTPTPKLLAVVRVAKLYGLGKFHILANGHLITNLLLYCTPHYVLAKVLYTSLHIFNSIYWSITPYYISLTLFV